jgi:hypothetical protein
MGNSKELEELLKLMSENQKHLFDKLTSARTPAVRPAGTKSKAPLAASELQKLKAEAEAFKASQRNAGMAISQLITARLDAAITKGDVEEIRRAILEQRGMYDDCNCTGAF